MAAGGGLKSDAVARGGDGGGRSVQIWADHVDGDRWQGAGEEEDKVHVQFPRGASGAEGIVPGRTQT